jgi:hypothetical protein
MMSIQNSNPCESFGLKVRNYTHGGCKYISIIDAFSFASNDPKKTWNRFMKSNPDMLTDVYFHQFPGAGQRLTPVAKEELIVDMMFMLPGAKAREFLRSVARINIMLPLPGTTQRRLGDGRACTLYIRGPIPQKLCLPSTYVKHLTLEVMKFGITNSLSTRNVNYNQDTDNGYFMFSFSCSSRRQAKIIEDILIHDFSSVAVLGSREYIDVLGMASILGCNYEPGSYSSYAAVAQKLFAYMVQRIHLLWPNTAHIYGNSYDIITDNSTLVRSTEDGSVRVHSDLSFRCNLITEERAIELGIKVPLEPRVQPVPRDENPTAKEVKKVDVATGEASPWPSIAKAAESVGWCAAKMSRTIDNGTVEDGFKYVVTRA